ncbi:uncharacterized protein Dwil_GK24651 [Drosophila willistoni]|uniref:Cell division cycle protein 26 homolog n=1 Tax=Drosophila willistoni TaxID=7260 RepID=B4N0X0_DROWI|nr:uncharacterized protein LOC6644401 [Drosophila willistoni]XP_023032368.1 uncharacterized protein LOC6644401 [Drosophila willistoni]EDW77733.1 uncharacterized protein Dwil_GK24651 [Drosophila willistoni]
MRRRELQTIQLKLSELKEYEQAKMERAKARQQLQTPRTPTPTSTSDRDSDSIRIIESAVIKGIPQLLLGSGSTEDEGTPEANKQISSAPT